LLGAGCALGLSSTVLLANAAQAQSAEQDPLKRAKKAVESLINRLRGRDMPDGIVKSNGRLEATQVDVSAKYPGRLATLTVNEGDEVLIPSPTYPLYTAVLAKIGANGRYYRKDPSREWMPDLDHLRSLVTPRTRVLVVIDPNNPTGAVYPAPVRRALIEFADRHDLVILADEVYGDIAFDGAVPLMGTLDRQAPIISLSSLSKAYLAPGWRAGWLVVGASPRLDDVLAAIRKLADGRLCSPGPMQYAVAAALTGDPADPVDAKVGEAVPESGSGFLVSRCPRAPSAR
jgi:aspartate/methionine/tyrosine aminotransferase